MPEVGKEKCTVECKPQTSSGFHIDPGIEEHSNNIRAVCLQLDIHTCGYRVPVGGGGFRCRI